MRLRRYVNGNLIINVINWATSVISDGGVAISQQPSASSHQPAATSDWWWQSRLEDFPVNAFHGISPLPPFPFLLNGKTSPAVDWNHLNYVHCNLEVVVMYLSAHSNWLKSTISFITLPYNLECIENGAEINSIFNWNLNSITYQFREEVDKLWN